MRALLIAFLLCLTSAHAVGASLDGIGDGTPLVIEGSGGGDVNDFQLKALDLLAKGTPVIIDGPCLSACTILVDIDRANVCITTQAIFGYHKAAQYNVLLGTKTEFNINYETPGLNEYIKSRGGLPSPDDANLMLMTFEQAKHFYKPCHGAH